MNYIKIYDSKKIESLIKQVNTKDINIGKLGHYRLGNRKQYKNSKSNRPRTLKLIFDCYESKQNCMSQLSNLKNIENKIIITNEYNTNT